MSIFFYDSYAVIEYLKNNSDFFEYFEKATGLMTIFNMVEVYYCVLRESGKEVADSVYNTLSPLVVEPSNESIRRAMVFRLHHKKKKLSYADCIGYQISQERKIKFLTGDEQFRDIDGVEFRK